MQSDGIFSRRIKVKKKSDIDIFFIEKEIKKKMAADSVPAISIPGGWIDGNFDLLEVKKVGEFAVDEYNKEQEKSLEFVRVLRAQKQIVNGVMYKLLLEAIDEHDVHKIYEALVYVKRQDGMELLQFYPLEFSRVVIGGWTDAGNDVEIEDLAKFAVDEYNKEKGTTLEFIKLKNAQKQLVAGVLYRLNLKAIDDGHKKLYQAKVLVKSWENIKELVDFKPLLLTVQD